jgi:hypothetical protein
MVVPMIENLPYVDFSPRDWELAPQYRGEKSSPGLISLEFGTLKKMAAYENKIGSFRETNDKTMARAPLFVDDLPAAFYQISTTHEQVTPKHNSTDLETIVVVNGILKLAKNEYVAAMGTDKSHIRLAPGDVTELQDEAVVMQAVGFTDPASCLALVLYRDQDVQVVPILN